MAVSIVPVQPVTQDEILHIVALDNEIYRLKKLRKRAAQSVFHRLDAGAACEPGAHIAEIVEMTHGGTRTKRLHIR